MEEGVKSENHLTSAAAFVEGGIQEACDDACSICLEAFCESEPSTVYTSETVFFKGWISFPIANCIFPLAGDLLQARVSPSVHSWMVVL